MKISVIGGYGVGMTMRLDHSPNAGETVTGGVLSTGPGGKGSNQAIACARLGAEVSLLTAVGSDAAGDHARALWAAEGVDASAVPTTPAATMTGFILVDATGENRIAIAPGALDLLSVRDLDGFAEQIRASDVLLVSLEIPIDVAVAALALARNAGVTTILNPAPAAALPQSVWASVDYLTPNATEAELLLAGTRDSAVTVVTTRGGLPTQVDAPGGVSFSVDSIPVDSVVDTTGAGDAFSAAFAVAIAERRELTDAVRFASAAGALAVGVAEVVPSLPHRAAIEEFLTHHSRKAELS